MKQVLLIVCCCIGFLSALAQPANKPRRMPGTEGKDPHPEAKPNSALPVFNLVDANRKTWTNKNIPAQHKVIFAMFNPGCSHCDDFGALIHRLKDSLSNTTVIMMTFEENFKELKNFLQKVDWINKKCACWNLQQWFYPGSLYAQLCHSTGDDLFETEKLKQVLYESITSQDLMRYLGN
ncbi:MAG: hypothetical protein HWD58_10100 [Bacteroidota bacterium]|nr:MAG: hypothetical protein HWD58_10100 [Bacteroidota bacterium]